MLALLSLCYSVLKGGNHPSFDMEALHSLIYWGQVTTVETLAWDKAIFYGAKVFTWARWKLCLVVLSLLDWTWPCVLDYCGHADHYTLTCRSSTTRLAIRPLELSDLLRDDEILP